MYTKWGQGIVSDAVPVDVLYYRINLYAVSTRWSGWIAQDGELMNVFTLGALSMGSEPPPYDDLNTILNVPDKLSDTLSLPGNAVVFDLA